jgi:PAS domain S-box-containing protein
MNYGHPGRPFAVSGRGRLVGRDFRLPAAVAFLVTIALGGAGFATTYFLGVATAHYHAANTADDLRANLGQLAGLTTDLANPTTSVSTVSTPAAELEGRVNADLAKLRHTGFESEDVNPLAAKITGFLAGFERERQLAQAGHTAEVTALARQQDPLYYSLASQGTRVVAQLRGDADNSDKDVRTGLLGTLVGIVAFVAGLLWWAGRHQRTAQLRAETASRAGFQSLVENGADMISILGPDARLRYVSPTCQRILGYQPDEIVAIDPVVELVHVEDRMAFGAALGRCLDTPRAVVGDLQVRMLHRDGRWRWLEGNVCNRLADPAVGGCVLTLHDVTDRKSAESDLADSSNLNDALTRAGEELRLAKDSADRANLAKSEFLSRMSHELRTPMNAILGFAQLLDMSELEPDDAESAHQIGKAGAHLLKLIDEVLDISRIESGAQVLSLEAVRLSHLVPEVTDLVRLMALERQIRVSTGPGCPDSFVLSDLQRLKQVLLNLLSNAVKYNRPGGTVTVQWHQVDGDVVIDVIDTGNGIPERLQDRLFRPFERLGAEMTGVQGTGLGLALSSRLVESMGGTITVESSATGTTFTVRLASALRPEANDSIDWLDEHPPDTPPLASHHLTVLYIEDNVSNLRLVERALALRPGTVVMAAMQGSIGVELARQHQPGLILLDLNLPDIHGLEVLRLLKADPITEATPVVVITADAMSGAADKARVAGAIDVVFKPIDVKGLLDIVDGVLAPAAVR